VGFEDYVLATGALLVVRLVPSVVLFQMPGLKRRALQVPLGPRLRGGHR